MRKQDYQILAGIIKAIRDESAATIADVGQFCDDESKDCARAERDAVENVAQRFSDRASVDKPAFLKACGM